MNEEWFYIWYKCFAIPCERMTWVCDFVTEIIVLHNCVLSSPYSPVLSASVGKQLKSFFFFSTYWDLFYLLDSLLFIRYVLPCLIEVVRNSLVRKKQVP